MRHTTKLNLITAGILLAVTGTVTPLATAQEDTENDNQIEKIIVSAQKRAQSLEDVSISVTALNESLLDKGGIDDVSRLELLVPGVNFAFAGNDAKFNVRGANSTNTFGDNSSIVGAFVDGVYKARASQQTRAFFDVSAVEFLRGPQGTLYGRNTFAGALNVYTKKPDTTGVEGGYEISYQRFDRFKGEGFVNLPISENSAFRFAAFFDKSDGFIQNDAGPDIGAQDDRGLRLSFMTTPNDDLEFVFRYSRIEEDGNEAGLFGYTFLCRNETPQGLTDPFGSVRNCENPVRGSGALGTAANGPGGDPWRISQDYVRPVDLEEDVFSLHIEYDVGELALKSITSYTDYRNDINFDFDFSPTPNSNGGYFEASKGFSQEFQAVSTGDGALQWTAGAYYSDLEDTSSFYIYQQTVRDDSTRPTTTFNGQQVTLLRGTNILSNDISLNGFFADSGVIDTEYYGVFFQGDYSVSDEVRLIAGLRYNDEDKSFSCGGSNFTGDTNEDGTVDRAVNVANGVAGSSPVVLPSNASDVFTYNCGASDAITRSENFSNVTWKAGVEYDLEEDILLYLTGSTGYLSGSISAQAVTDEQESQVIEFGMRSILLDNTLQLNAAFHYTEYDNLLTQRQEVNPETGTAVTFTDNGGEIEAKGIEVDARWLPTEQLTLSGNIAWLDSEYGTYGQQNPYQLYNGEVRSFIDQNGQRTPWSPELTVSFTAAYEIDLGQYGFLTPYFQFYYSDDYNTSNLLSTDPSQQQDSYTKTDIRLVWESPDYDYQVEIFAENLEDEAVLARGNNNSDDIVQSSYLYPFNWGVKFKARF